MTPGDLYASLRRRFFNNGKCKCGIRMSSDSKQLWRGCQAAIEQQERGLQSIVARRRWAEEQQHASREEQEKQEQLRWRQQERRRWAETEAQEEARRFRQRRLWEEEERDMRLQRMHWWDFMQREQERQEWLRHLQAQDYDWEQQQRWRERELQEEEQREWSRLRREQQQRRDEEQAYYECLLQEHRGPQQRIWLQQQKRKQLELHDRAAQQQAGEAAGQAGNLEPALKERRDKVREPWAGDSGWRRCLATAAVLLSAVV